MTISIDDDSELKSRVRAATGYEDSPNELPDSDLDHIIDTAKLRLSLEANSQKWFVNDGLGLALFGYTCMRAKSSIENIPLQSYTLGDETVSVDTDDPEDSQQIQQWAEDVATGLAAFESTQGTARTPTNTAQYVGESSIKDFDEDQQRYS